MANSNKLSSLSVFFPAYNEEANLRELLLEASRIIPKVAHKFEIIIVNDGSNDGTADVGQQLVKTYPYVRFINHHKNLGYGQALRSGIKNARYNWIFFTDADRQFDLSQLEKFIPFTSDYDAVIGYRQNRAEGQLRAFNAWLFKQYVNVLFRVHVKDIDCAFKLMKSEVIQQIPLMSNGAMISAEILYQFKKRHISIKQLPVKHLPRLHGSPTGNHPKVVIKAGFEALRLYIAIKFGHNKEVFASA